MSAPEASSTIVAVATAPGRGAIGLIRLSGSDAVRIGREIFRARPALAPDRRVRRGRVLGPDGRTLDDALAWCLAGPRTYTGEDTVEVSTHGSPSLLALVVEAACRHGARRAAPGQFTRRAFLNGRLDLIQAEAVADLIAAGSRAGFEVAYGALSGALSERLHSIRDRLVDALAVLEAGLDFSEDVSDSEVCQVADLVEAVRLAAGGLVEGFAGARRRLEGYRVAIVGAPNAGKSTLFNRLSGQERALVSERPGTTRDWIEVEVVWSGHVLRLIDTAGLGHAADGLEAEGMIRTRQQLAGADVVVQVVDGAVPGPLVPLAPAGTAAAVITLNKADLPRRVSVPADLESLVMSISARTGAGLEDLQREILARLPSEGRAEVALVRERHVDGLRVVERAATAAAVELAHGSLETAAEELQVATRALASVLGETWDEAILDRIFADFCVGK